MKKYRFEEIDIIGCGMISGTVLKSVIKSQAEYQYKIKFIKSDATENELCKELCRISESEFMEIENRKEVTKYLQDINCRSLIISAGNYYLFPKSVVKKHNLTIINFHNALLPKYPGRNAASWSIYSGDSVSGATWHYVTEQIDAGEILWQGKCDITEDMKAYELSKAIMEIAQTGFESIFPQLLEKRLSGKVQNNNGEKMCLSKDIPGDGKFSVNDSPRNIYRLLRTMDYGKNRVFPFPRFELDGKVFIVKRYKVITKEEAADRSERLNTINFNLDNKRVLTIKYEEIK